MSLDPLLLNSNELFCFENAVRFRIVRGKGASRVSIDASSFEDAVFKAEEFGRDKRSMIYAITADDRSAHIVNV